MEIVEKMTMLTKDVNYTINPEQIPSPVLIVMPMTPSNPLFTELGLLL